MRAALASLALVTTAAVSLSAQTPALAGKAVTPAVRDSASGTVCDEHTGLCGERPTETPRLLRGNPIPRYPDALRYRRIEGQVDIQFVVDTSGRIETASAYVLHSDHELFIAAIKDLLPRLRYAPGKVGKRKARVVVTQTFSFKVP
ncbi:MAG: TonB family protein [Gemmatimonadaceae bacterium]